MAWIYRNTTPNIYVKTLVWFYRKTIFSKEQFRKISFTEIPMLLKKKSLKRLKKLTFTNRLWTCQTNMILRQICFRAGNSNELPLQDCSLKIRRLFSLTNRPQVLMQLPPSKSKRALMLLKKTER